MAMLRGALRAPSLLRATATRGLSSQCPFAPGSPGAGSDPSTGGRPQQWWPNQLNLKVLHAHNDLADPHKGRFDYAEEFKKCDLTALRADLMELMTDSQDWWPADYGSYAGFFIRMAWHSAGTYRIFDGRGGAGAGQLRFAPLNSWPDNGNLDKARRLLWPIKQKYGSKISWADLMIFTGNVALESGGFKTFGFAGGRADVWEPEEDVYWGPESAADGWLADGRYAASRDAETLDQPLGAVQMGLIYVNPQGPNGNPDPLKSAHDIRETFARMAMGDEETVALIAGGHTYGKGHGAADPDKHVGPEPEGAPIEEQGFGWRNSLGSGRGADTITSGLEGAWTRDPTKWDNDYFDLLFGYEWELGKGAGGGHQWYPTDQSLADSVPDAHDASKRHMPTMFTTDVALKEDPVYGPISKRFHENPEQFADAFARAWYKLTHRDMGPAPRYLGVEVPAEELIWQDPVPAPRGSPLSESDVAGLKAEILGSGLTVPQLVGTAWASASTFRGTDKRGGANGARIRLAPQKDWEVNKAAGTQAVLAVLGGIQAASSADVSVADLVVLGGCAAVEEAARQAGHAVSVPFVGGRTDASQEQTDVDSFAVLEPTADGFRNHLAAGHSRSAEELLVDKAHLLTLTAPEMTVLVGGMRVLGANAGTQAELGVFTAAPGTLTNDFFTGLLEMDQAWEGKGGSDQEFEAKGSDGSVKRAGSRVDLLFGSNSQLRAVAESYAEHDSGARFASDFAAAFGKVMHLDRYDA